MSTEPYAAARKAAHVAMTVLFLGAIWLPLASRPLGLGANRLDENRAPATRPRLVVSREGLREFPSKYEAYFNDSFAFRSDFIRWHNYAKLFWLRVSPSPYVFLGKAGWLYYAGEHDIEDFRHVAPLTAEQLERWRLVYQARRDWLARRGIRYLVTIPPSKHTVYPEYVPAKYRRVAPRSRYDQLVAHLREHSDLEFLDLREPLLRAKSAEPLYYSLDSHWNQRGAFVAYQEIVRRLGRWFPGLRPLPRSEFQERVSERTFAGDLPLVLGLVPYFRDDEVELLRRTPRRARPVEAPTLLGETPCPPGQQPVVTEVDHPDLPRAVMFRDSFATALAPLLSEHFGRIAYIWHRPFDADIIEAERPQVVIDEMVERNLWREPPTLQGLPLDNIARAKSATVTK